MIKLNVSGVFGVLNICCSQKPLNRKKFHRSFYVVLRDEASAFSCFTIYNYVEHKNVIFVVFLRSGNNLMRLMLLYGENFNFRLAIISI